jgi:hypothetical protein
MDMDGTSYLVVFVNPESDDGPDDEAVDDGQAGLVDEGHPAVLKQPDCHHRQAEKNSRPHHMKL